MISTSYDLDESNLKNSSSSNNDEESIYLSSSSEDEPLINNFASRKNKDKKIYIAKVNVEKEDEFSNESDESDLEIPLKRDDNCISIDDDDDDDDEYYDDDELNRINRNYHSKHRNNYFVDDDDQSTDVSEEDVLSSNLSKALWPNEKVDANKNAITTTIFFMISI
jgi:hypothetical protein